MNPEISVIIPAKDEEESLSELCQWISRVMQEHGFSYEVIFIDDGSKDNTWLEIKKINELDSRFKGIRLNRTFAISAALQTGFRVAQGRGVITSDADLHDSPDEIPGLPKMIVQVVDRMVTGWTKKR